MGAERGRMCGIKLHLTLDMGRTILIIELQTRRSSGSGSGTVACSRVKHIFWCSYAIPPQDAAGHQKWTR